MTKPKQMEKEREEQKRAFRMEITELEHDLVSVKSPIILSREQYNLIEKVCNITDERLEQYIKDALLQAIQIDLDNPSCFGQTVCEVLRKQWDLIKPK